MEKSSELCFNYFKASQFMYNWSPLGLRQERGGKKYIKKCWWNFFKIWRKTLNLKIQEVKVMNPKYTKRRKV